MKGFAENCAYEDEFVFIVANIWSNDLFLECEVYILVFMHEKINKVLQYSFLTLDGAI